MWKILKEEYNASLYKFRRDNQLWTVAGWRKVLFTNFVRQLKLKWRNCERDSQEVPVCNGFGILAEDHSELHIIL